MNDEIVGVIPAGGMSRRMGGRDKGLSEPVGNTAFLSFDPVGGLASAGGASPDRIAVGHAGGRSQPFFRLDSPHATAEASRLAGASAK